jgi:hypothetical protein
MRPENERIEVSRALEELANSSFIEITQSSKDNMFFISIPLAASIFGRPKIDVSPMKGAIEADSSLMQTLGAAQFLDIKQGIRPRIRRLFLYIASRIAVAPEELAKHLPMLEFIARKYPPAWLMIASLHEEAGTADSFEKAKEALRRYIESTPGDSGQWDAWDKLSKICYRTEDWKGEIHASIEMCKLPDVSFFQISNSARVMNSLLAKH